MHRSETIATLLAIGIPVSSLQLNTPCQFGSLHFLMGETSCKQRAKKWA